LVRLRSTRTERKEEVLEEVVLYMLNDPVCTGLADDHRSYAFSGSFVFDTKEM